MFNLNNVFTAQLSAEVHSVHMELSYNWLLLVASDAAVISLESDFSWCLQKESKDYRDLIRRLKTEHAEQYAELETLKVCACSCCILY